MTIHNRYIPFYIIAASSMAAVIFAAVSIRKFGSRTISTKLVLYLFATLFIEEITSIPYAYEYNAGFCECIGFVHTFSGMCNVVVVLLMMLVYRYIFIEDTQGVTKVIVSKLELIVFGPSLVISLLPLTTSSYGKVNGVWCDLQSNNGASRTWALLIFFFWIVLIIALSIFVFFVTVWRVHKSDPEMAHKLVCSIGQYGIVSIITWIPRMIARKGIIDKEYANMLVFLSGICLFTIFLRQKSSLKLFELFSAENTFDLDSANSSVRPSSHMFTWEDDDEDTAIVRKSRMSSTASSASFAMSKRSTMGLSTSAATADVVGKSIGNPML